MHFKVSTLEIRIILQVYKSFNGPSPSYLSGCSYSLVFIPKTFGKTSMYHSGPHLWTKGLEELRIS